MAAVRQKMHVRKGDTVMVITGKDVGRKGKVLQVLPKKGRVIVEKVNIVKRHTRPSQSLPQGGIVEKEAPIASSNVMLYCPECNSVTRLRVKMTDSGKVRVCTKCGMNLPEK
ncbi:ribosomal protein uL24 [Acididesulfobacillus acetoxydans]|uniref:Large ribosomal subunit protein uL24 n=1 Tax=Acididesulfobacillus acetoxydans TaxID=1561005 RepID=A0A8S0WEI2_9FIRM|nr:50S ribosomal protein L24 [Acididesulfobacillus acetoxydans]CAA7600152.1 ribosomal protein uL24 [Acididesulfobacillus acetoxydans]CEJ09530.1 50S ribosomal protein L24 [Acididesulfobacillus acetoxydans]